MRLMVRLLVLTVAAGLAGGAQALAQDVDAARESDCAEVTAQFRAAVDTFIEAYPDHPAISYDELELYAIDVLPNNVDPQCVPDIVSTYESKDYRLIYRGYVFAFPVEEFYKLFGIKTSIVASRVILHFIVMKDGAIKEIIVSPKWDTMWVP